jgi:DNA-directed RNA polymerase subunit N (RpoN/RPB10)|tara:strand:+ start:181 stop:441 length:261 start_codon:yes stop_codon:yes gene_type:complete
MIIPVRCFTCSKVIADLWEEYTKKVNSQTDIKNKKYTLEEITIKSDEDPLKYFDDNHKNKILNELGITKMCCRRHFLGHVDLIDVI